MQVKPIAHHIELNTQDRSGPVLPESEIVITSPRYDQVREDSPFTDLRDVVPAVIATRGDGLGRFWTPSGLRVGQVMIYGFGVQALGGLEATVDTAGAVFHHQLDDHSDVVDETYPNTPLFTGGVVSWGDGFNQVFDASFPSIQHTYAEAGTYNVRLELHFPTSGNLAWSSYPSAVRTVQVS